MRRFVERGFTLVEIMIVVAIIALLAAIAIPNVLRGRTTANESAAIGNMRALVSSLEMYRSVYSVYPRSAANFLADMYTTPDPDFGPPSFAVSMQNNTIQGYRYTFNRNSDQTYNITAQPLDLGRTGTRSFYVDEAGTIRHCSGNAGASAGNNTIDTTPNAAC